MAATPESPQTDDDRAENDQEDSSTPDTLPDEKFRPSTRARFEPPKDKPQRRSAFRIRLPIIEDEFETLPDYIRGCITQVIEKVRKETAGGINQFEVLQYPGPVGLELILSIEPKRNDARSTNQSTVGDFVDRTHEAGANKLTKAIQKYVPEECTVERGSLDLSPLGTTPVNVSRLHLRKDHVVNPVGTSGVDVLATTFNTLREHSVAFVYQTLLKPKQDGQYTAAVRLATYPPQFVFTGREDFVKIAERGHPFDLATTFGAYNLTSNFRGLTDRYWETEYTEKINGESFGSASYTDEMVTSRKSRSQARREADQVKEIVLGKADYWHMLSANATWDTLLKKELNRYARFDITGPFVAQLTGLVRLRWKTNPWGVVPGREPPKFYTEEILNTYGSTAPNYGDNDELMHVPDETLANTGSIEHHGHVQSIIDIFTEGGDEIYEITQNSKSLPDIELHTETGEVSTIPLTVDASYVSVEAELHNKTKATTTLVNADRAYAMGRHVIFVYDSFKSARLGYTHLSQPYNDNLSDRDDGGVRLYNRTKPVRCPDDRIPVMKGSTTTTWELFGRDRIVARVNDERIAGGTPGGDVGEFSWDTHFYQEVDGVHRVEDADGAVIETYNEQETFTAEWTKIPLPHIPICGNYLHFATVAYRTGEGGIDVYSDPPDWDTPDSAGKMKRHRGCLDTFTDQLICERDDARISSGALQTWAQHYYTAASAHDTPPGSIIVQALPEEIKGAKKGGTNNRNPHYPGYDWVIPPEIDTPHRPGVEEGLTDLTETLTETSVADVEIDTDEAE
ncbi:hypothetical protein EXE48_04355 [Halorubrum sp. ASP1]|uniref:hypothetical protein n=1 Tax=Halorubrum sp. ASP1 TaxID=2518114 RepID=UPI0010F58E43|nr:hypothetical protein [Halorubrum sp. ASP1]TKX62992.1 hypothetical protein EXE48_04355 [Halorubrum sp. ASP1]